MSKSNKRRSSHWYGKLDKDGFIHRSWMKSQGFPDHVFDGRPIIGICNTWSELTRSTSAPTSPSAGASSGASDSAFLLLLLPFTSLAASPSCLT